MTDENSKLAEDLNQLRLDLEKQMAGVEAHKETADTELIADIEKLESDGWQMILDIQTLQSKIGKEQSELLDD